MPRSKTATDCDVFAVISLAIKRPVQPPPMMATSTGLRLVIERSLAFLLRDPCSEQFSPYCHAARTLSRSPGTYRIIQCKMSMRVRNRELRFPMQDEHETGNNGVGV